MRDKLIELCKLTQDEIKQHVIWELKDLYADICVGDGYVLAKGEYPILLVAHLDTVHEKLPDTIIFDKEKDSVSSPQGIGGDDRCGVLMVLELIRKYKCSVLFCEDEEKHGIGAMKFVQSAYAYNLDFNYIIEFDRKGSSDAVFYKCENKQFIDFVTKDFYTQAFGTFSDICILAPYFDCAAVNLSCGYYNAHQLTEYVILKDMQESLAAAERMLARTGEKDKFVYGL